MFFHHILNSKPEWCWNFSANNLLQKPQLISDNIAAVCIKFHAKMFFLLFYMYQSYRWFYLSTGSFGFFRGSVLGQDASEPQPSTGETQEDVNNVNSRCDMTEILLKAA